MISTNERKLGENMTIHEERVKKITAFLETVANLDLSISQEVGYNIQFTAGITPVLTLIPPTYKKIPHNDFKQIMTATEDHGLNFSFQEGVFKIS